MKYKNYIELSEVTVGDCLDLLKYKDTRVIINDGNIINFEEERD